ncbi:hypothetical protein C1645_872781 [Glomus cerebriforme]|uniref:Galactose oxidase n=1 Tax=Glomus cerebriforme TaxID=658196 RepID=A0A397TG82_9GLOM|nr:hypothetical protein C1645_872781 [Glomus cerebriforme]
MLNLMMEKYIFFVGSESDDLGRIIRLNTGLQDLTWVPGENINPPSARYGYAATLTKVGLILYIGGIYRNGFYANMNEIPIFDAIKDNWLNAIMDSTGEIIPEGRQMHSAVLSDHNTIIIYGGYHNGVFSKPELVILDISKPVYNWIQPTTNEIIEPRWGHTSTFIYSQMIVAFEINSTLSILSNPTKTSFNRVSSFSIPNPVKPPIINKPLPTENLGICYKQQKMEKANEVNNNLE